MFLFLTGPATTVPGMTFRLLFRSSALNSAVAEVALGTRFLSVNTRIMLVSTDPFLETQIKQNLYKGCQKHMIIWCLSVTEI